MIASPSLRDRLMNLSGDVVQSFIKDFGSFIGEADDIGQIIIWGQDPYNEISWEVSQPLLERWGWLLGREFVDRSSAWRMQRGAPPLPECGVRKGTNGAGLDNTTISQHSEWRSTWYNRCFICIMMFFQGAFIWLKVTYRDHFGSNRSETNITF
ncbi:hypothetical protein EYC84_010251 [Monilinia fructicola]|nr:hypothetical protein EYC84_010251 [Monilinia fructicola]